jgi:hypothetical protein
MLSILLPAGNGLESPVLHFFQVLP